MFSKARFYYACQEHMSITAHTPWILMPAWLLKRQQCKWGVYLTEMWTSQIKKPNIKPPYHVWLQKLHMTKSGALGESSGLRIQRTTRQEFTNQKAHISALLILCKFTLALLASCYIKGAITTDTNLNRSHSENTAYFSISISELISTFRVNMLLSSWNSASGNPLPFQRNDILIEPNDIIG